MQLQCHAKVMSDIALMRIGCDSTYFIKFITDDHCEEKTQLLFLNLCQLIVENSSLLLFNMLQEGSPAFFKPACWLVAISLTGLNIYLLLK